MPAKRPAIAAPKVQASTRIGTGKALLPNVDGRSGMMRRYREILATLFSDMGGDPSEAKAMIARRAATLSVWCEAAEADMANGLAINISEFTTATNALRRLLADLGLERKEAAPLTVDGYLAATREAAQ